MDNLNFRYLWKISQLCNPTNSPSTHQPTHPFTCQFKLYIATNIFWSPTMCVCVWVKTEGGTCLAYALPGPGRQTAGVRAWLRLGPARPPARCRCPAHPARPHQAPGVWRRHQGRAWGGRAGPHSSCHTDSTPESAKGRGAQGGTPTSATAGG